MEERFDEYLSRHCSTKSNDPRGGWTLRLLRLIRQLFATRQIRSYRCTHILDTFFCRQLSCANRSHNGRTVVTRPPRAAVAADMTSGDRRPCIHVAATVIHTTLDGSPRVGIRGEECDRKQSYARRRSVSVSARARAKKIRIDLHALDDHILSHNFNSFDLDEIIDQISILF